MTTSTDSVPNLIDELCSSFLGNPQRAFLSQPQESREQVKKSLQRKAFDTVFGYLNSQQCIEDKGKDERLTILSFILQPRYRRKFDEANRLEELLDSLDVISDEETSAEKETVRSVLKFLVSLAELPNQSESTVIGHGEYKYPKIKPMSEADVLPWGPQCYGDSQVSLPENRFYMHYPMEIFLAEPVKQVEQYSNV